MRHEPRKRHLPQGAQQQQKGGGAWRSQVPGLGLGGGGGWVVLGEGGERGRWPVSTLEPAHAVLRRPLALPDEG